MNRYIAHDGHTKTVPALQAAHLEDDAFYVFGPFSEEHRLQQAIWHEMLEKRPSQCVQVVEQQQTAMRYRTTRGEAAVSLLDNEGLQAIFSRAVIYVDITGLNHSVWASLLRASLSSLEAVFFVYTEPGAYKEHESPSSSSLFDLTAAFGGVAPLPGMANLSGPGRDVKSVLVPFLGFESARPKHIALDFDPQPQIMPVVGLPGFKLDYPQITISTNNEFLTETRAYEQIRFARASCPFEAYSALSEIQRDNPGCFLHIAPTGTKPHALGAVWYAFDHPRDTEIIYDHPIRKGRRTTGVGPTHIYSIKPRHADI
ncbi:hypothetical protein [Cupriavidus taiwanensis]|uniref:hypothetical protein n=1 Tax=Cupriavidus taiwanensis TaxID=164546 RepID=UPI000E104FEA|nr:hypothetical protein [Cupriavidus taiwanensis]SOZ17010.1 hypothetical protein CBM2597_P340029 [Cupriavidus taiwanensis]SOZ95942.1 hypothetical protein CBM2598_P310033 [Cupriavidus taiwanensis]SPD37658.1 protein of unknown function [Cupriavidus taiwanensis]